MKLTFVKPRQELQPYIKSLWVFESAAGIPQTDTSLAAPNGCPKLILLYENSLESVVEGRVQVSGPGLYFVGNRDVSARIRSSPRKTGFIGIEFSPHGAFPVFGRGSPVSFGTEGRSPSGEEKPVSQFENIVRCSRTQTSRRQKETKLGAIS